MLFLMFITKKVAQWVTGSVGHCFSAFCLNQDDPNAPNALTQIPECTGLGFGIQPHYEAPRNPLDVWPSLAALEGKLPKLR